MATIASAQVRAAGKLAPLPLVDARVPQGATLVLTAKLTPAGISKQIVNVQYHVDADPHLAIASFDRTHRAELLSATDGLAIGQHGIALALRGPGEQLFAGDKVARFSVVSPSAEAPRITSKQVALESVDVFDAADSAAPSHRDGLTLQPGEALLVEGWAYDNTSASPAHAVWIVVDGKRAFSAQYGITRPDVAAYYKNESYTKTGFAAIVPADAIGPGAHTVAVVVGGRRGTVLTPSAASNLKMTVQ